MEAMKQIVLFDFLLFNTGSKHFVSICLVKHFFTDYYEIMKEENVVHSEMKSRTLLEA